VDEPQIGRLLPPIVQVTTPELAIVRFHGRNVEGWQKRASTSERSRYLYSLTELQEWAPRIKDLARKAAETHAVFNNAYKDNAVCNAHQFMELLEREGLEVKRPKASLTTPELPGFASTR
jgi:uncharacterized protein YecE (DUF72 family)